MAGRNLTFDGATIESALDLEGASIVGTLSLVSAFAGELDVYQEAKEGGVVLDPNEARLIVDPIDRIATLQKIEQTARTAGDTATANNARFDWLQLAGQERLNRFRPWSLPWIRVWLQGEDGSLGFKRD